MKFVLHEMKLWLKNKNLEPKSYKFLSDKVNIITGGSNTGKTSFWNIIDYCLLANKINIAKTVVDKVLWFGIHFSINDKDITIVRKSPEIGSVSLEIYFSNGGFPKVPHNNTTVAEVKSFLDKEFGITDALRFPYGEKMGKVPFELSYRHFLIFNSLTENIIGVQEPYFDTYLYGKEEYDKALHHIFNLVIGVNDMEKIKAFERLQEVKKEIEKIEKQIKQNDNKSKKFEQEVRELFDKCKEYNYIEYSVPFENKDIAVAMIQDVIKNMERKAQDMELFKEIDKLNENRRNIQRQISAISQYKNQYDAYKKNLEKSADSLQPIIFLKERLSEQLLSSSETNDFVEYLETSLKNIKEKLSKSISIPIRVEGDEKELKKELNLIEEEIAKIEEINKNNKTEGDKFIAIGEIKSNLERLLKSDFQKTIDNVKLNALMDEKMRLDKVPSEIESVKFTMKTLLNESIQKVYNQINSIPEYKRYSIVFEDTDMLLRLRPPLGELQFPIDNVGSKSNYMFMHLCLYLGLHKHIMDINPEHVPQFLFIDQPSIPYYSGGEINENDDKAKLLDAFSLINTFVENTVKEGKSFQILMVEHAPKNYWEKRFSNFHTVDEFINGKGLIPLT